MPAQTKNKTGRVVIPMVEEPATLLEQQYSRRKNGFPFVCWRGENSAPVPIVDFHSAWETAVTQAGLLGLLFHVICGGPRCAPRYDPDLPAPSP